MPSRKYRVFPIVAWLVYDMSTAMPIQYNHTVKFGNEGQAKAIALLLNDWEDAIEEDNIWRMKQAGKQFRKEMGL